MTSTGTEWREYRLVTGGEDGIVAWWNLLVPSPGQAHIEYQKKLAMKSGTVTKSKISTVGSNIEEISFAHQIYLSTIAGMHVLVNGPQVDGAACFVAVQNDLIMTFYRVKYNDLDK
jgi:hypothetical protein